jgi:hypothetical protein
MCQISSLEKLDIREIQNELILTTYPGAESCLKNLSELYCYSNIYPEFFYQLSQICHNIQILWIEFRDVISNGLADLISVQRNLRCLNLELNGASCNNFTDIIPSLMKISNSLTKLYLYSNGE